MLRAVSHAVFPEERADLLQGRRKRLVDRDITEGGTPCAIRKDGRLLSPREVAHAENQNLAGNRNAGEYRAGYASGIDISCVRHKARPDASGFEWRYSFCKFANERGQFKRVGRIKTSRDGRQAKHAAAPRIKQASKASL